MARDPLDLLFRAIEIEEKIYMFFEDASKHAKTLEIRGVLEELAEEELEHRNMLLSNVTEDFSRKETESLDTARHHEYLQLQPICVESTYQEMMHFAIKKADLSCQFFKQLELASLSKEMIKTYKKIANLELALKNRLERLLFEFYNNLKGEKNDKKIANL